MNKYGQYKRDEAPFSSGGMGEIFNGYDTALKRAVCIKVIKKELAESPAYRRRFKREAILMATVAHPNIVKIYNYGINGQVWIAMEKLEGTPLEFHAKPFSIPEVIRFFGQIAGAVGCVHRNGIAHCDIKPGNVILDNGRYVLIDFGLGFREDGDESTARTSVRSTGGTPVYAPPEQTVGEPIPASDVYSLGCTVYELVTGRRPFEDKRRVPLANSHANHPRPSATAIRPECPLWLSDLIAHCMSIDADDRPLPDDIVERLSLRETLDFKKSSVFIDPSFEVGFNAVSEIVRRYEVAERPEIADVVISGRLEFLENVPGRKIYIIHVDDDDSILCEAGDADVLTLIGPVEPYEILAAIEK